MGLDVSAYSKLTKIDEIDDVEEWEAKYWDDATWSNQTVLVHRGTFDLTQQNFPGRTDGLEPGTYQINGAQHGFRAGSYSEYNYWREWLCMLVFGVPPKAIWNDESAYAGKPFVELINFSDCEGYIGPKVAKKLAKDFADYEDRAISDEQWVVTKYADWKRAFELAADDGFVDFH